MPIRTHDMKHTITEQEAIASVARSGVAFWRGALDRGTAAELREYVGAHLESNLSGVGAGTVQDSDVFGASAPIGVGSSYGEKVEHRWNVLMPLAPNLAGNGINSSSSVLKRALRQVLHSGVKELLEQSLLPPSNASGASTDSAGHEAGVPASARVPGGSTIVLADLSALVADPGAKGQRLHYDTRYSPQQMAATPGPLPLPLFPMLSGPPELFPIIVPGDRHGLGPELEPEQRLALACASSTPPLSPKKVKTMSIEVPFVVVPKVPGEDEEPESRRFQNPARTTVLEQLTWSPRGADELALVDEQCAGDAEDDKAGNHVRSGLRPRPTPTPGPAAAAPGPLLHRENGHPSAYRIGPEKRLITVFTALQDITHDMGPTLIVPATNTEGAHGRVLDAEQNGELAAILEQFTRRGISCDLKAGDCVLMDSRALHLGQPNLSAERRVLLDFAFMLVEGEPSTYCGCIDARLGERYLQLADFEHWTSD